jgi:hypothetical protein
MRDRDPYVVTLVDLLIVWILDPVDSLPVQFILGRTYTGTYVYNVGDKIADAILYLFVVMNHIYRVGKVGAFEMWFLVLYIYRFVGIFIYIITDDPIFLVIFANFVSDTIMIYLFFKYVLHAPGPIVWGFTLLSIPLKVAYEAYHHIYYNPRICGESGCNI